MTPPPPSDARRRGWCPGALRPMPSGDGLLVRIKPSCGILTREQATSIAALASAYGNGLIELTSRGNLQLRGVTPETLPPLTQALDGLGLLDASPEAEARRNVIASPLAGLDPSTYDTRDVTRALEQALVAADAVSGLSDKFGFAVDGGGNRPLGDVAADIHFRWTGSNFAVGLARDDGCDWIGCCAPVHVPATALALARAFAACAPGARRMRHVDAAIRARIAGTPAAAQGLRVTPPSPDTPVVLSTTSIAKPSDISLDAAPPTASIDNASEVALDAAPPTASIDNASDISLDAAPSTASIDNASDVSLDAAPPTPSSRRRPGPTQISGLSTATMLAASDATSMAFVSRADAGVDPGLRRDDEEGSTTSPQEGSTTSPQEGSAASPNERAGPGGAEPDTAVANTNIVSVGLPFGGTTAEALTDLLKQCRQAGAAEVRLTPWRTLLIPVADANAVAALRQHAAALGFVTDAHDPRRAVAACPGAPACINGSTPVRHDADRFAVAAAAILMRGVTMHVSGCAKGCARRRPATITLVAEAGRYGLVVNGQAADPSTGRYTAQQAAETLARLASAMTKAGNASQPCTATQIQAALEEIAAA